MKYLKRGTFSGSGPSRIFTASATTKFGYDVGGRKVWEVDPNNNKTTWYYDDNYNRLAYRVDGNGVKTDFNYTDDNQLLTIGYSLIPGATYPSHNATFLTGQTVTMHYDGFNRLDSIQDPSGIRTFKYDGNDRVTHEETLYDDWNKTIALDFPYQDCPLDPTLRKELTITNNNACGSERKDFKFTYGYNTTTGQLTSLQDPFCKTSAWEYRYDSSITSQTLGNNAYTEYQRHSVWDQLMSLSNSTKKTSGTPLSTYDTFSYDWQNRLTKMMANIPALTGSGDNTKNWQWAYDSMDRLQSEQWTGATTKY